MAITNYSGTKCPKCEKTSFEMVEGAPTNSTYKYFYIRCSSCKTFLSVVEYLPFAERVEIIGQM